MINKYLMWVIVMSVVFLNGCADQSDSANNNEREKTVNFAGTDDKVNNRSDGEDARIEVAFGGSNIPASASPGIFDQGVYDSLGALEFAYGGLNYDKWYVAAEVANIPAVNHPLWTGTSPDVVNEGTWRCKQCHGWDYQGADGIYGIDPASKNFTGLCGFLTTANCSNTFTTAQEMWTFLHDGGVIAGSIANAADHAFADWLPEPAIYALTKFILTIREEAAAGNAPADKIGSDPANAMMFGMALGDQSNGMKLYSMPSEDGGCDIACHGADGKLIDFKPPNEKFVETYANDNPWEVLHKIRFGHPGAEPYMAGIAEYDNPMLDMQGGVDVLSYSQAGLLRSNVVGGRLYDNWVVETGADATQAFRNPLLDIAPDQGAAAAVPDVDGWLCGTCHGFDYEGGAFGFENNLVDLQSVNSWTSDYVFSVLKNGYNAVNPADGSVTRVHQYGMSMVNPGRMSDQRLWDLAEFAVTQIYDTHTFIRAPTGGIREPQGVAMTGHQIYNGVYPATLADGTTLDCVTCHGVDGKLASKADGSPTDIFKMAWEMPWMSFHRTKFGSPRLPGAAVESIMPGVMESVRADGHMMGNHHVADVQLFQQETLNSTAPATVANILRKRAAESVKQ